MRIAAVQMQSGTDPYENLLFVNDCVLEATDRDCDLVCFPEVVFYRGPRSSEEFNRADYVMSLDRKGHIDTPGLDFAAAVKDFAADWKIPVSLGSIFEFEVSTQRLYNSHWLVSPGARVQAYRKIHLFDYTNGPVKYRESDDFTAGDQPRAYDLNADFKVGLSICFDLRFPELYRDLVLKQQANTLLIPAAFTYETGQAHWDTLLRARAIENFSFVVAAAQWGSHKNAKGQELFCYGRTQIIDPWGTILAEAPTKGDALVIADLDITKLTQSRQNLPALTNTRLFNCAGESVGFKPSLALP